MAWWMASLRLSVFTELTSISQVIICSLIFNSIFSLNRLFILALRFLNIIYSLPPFTLTEAIRGLTILPFNLISISFASPIFAPTSPLHSSSYTNTSDFSIFTKSILLRLSMSYTKSSNNSLIATISGSVSLTAWLLCLNWSIVILPSLQLDITVAIFQVYSLQYSNSLTRLSFFSLWATQFGHSCTIFDLHLCSKTWLPLSELLIFSFSLFLSLSGNLVKEALPNTLELTRCWILLKCSIGSVMILYLFLCLRDFECSYLEERRREEKGCQVLVNTEDFFCLLIQLEQMVIGEGEGVLPFSRCTLLRLIIISIIRQFWGYLLYRYEVRKYEQFVMKQGW